MRFNSCFSVFLWFAWCAHATHDACIAFTKPLKPGLPVNASENACRISVRDHSLGPICSGITHSRTYERLAARRPQELLYTRHATAPAMLQQPQGTRGWGYRPEFGKSQRPSTVSPQSPASSQTPGYHPASSPNRWKLERNFTELPVQSVQMPLY